MPHPPNGGPRRDPSMKDSTRRWVRVARHARAAPHRPSSGVPGAVGAYHGRVQRTPVSGADIRGRLTRAAPVLPALAASAAVLFLALTGLGGRPLWRDECATWWAAHLPPADLLRLVAHVDAVLLPYYGLLHAYRAAFGDTEAALRLPSALAMAAAAGLTAELGRRLVSPRAGLLAGLVFAAIPAVTRYGQEARPYALAVAATAAATLLLVLAVERPGRWWRWAAYSLSVSAVGAAHLVALTVLAAHAVAVLTRTGGSRRRAVVIRFGYALAAGLAPLVPLALRGHAQAGQIAWIDAADVAWNLLPQRLFGTAAIFLTVAGLAAAGMIRLPRDCWALPAWALAPPVFLIAAWPAAHLLYFRYLLFTLPAWALLAGAGLDRLPRPAPAVAPVLRAVLVAVLIGYAVPGQAVVRRIGTGEPDLRTAARVMLAAGRPGDGIAFGGTGTYGVYTLRKGMAYELRRAVFADVLAAGPIGGDGGYGAAECPDPVACLAGVRRVWLVTSVSGANLLARMSPGAEAALRGSFIEQGRWSATRVRVALLSRP